MENGNGKIFVGIPRERFYMPTFVDNRDRILAQLHRSGRDCGFFQAEGHRVDRNRDTIVGEFLKHVDKPEWLLMLDSDMEFPENIAERLVMWDKPIVGGLYFHRGQSHDPFAFMNGPETTDKYGRKHRSWIPMRDEVYDYLQKNRIPMRDGALIVEDPNALVECDAVATGALLTHRSVFEAMLPGPWFEYESGGISEDLAFCANVKEKYGFPIFCDFSTIAGHMALVPMGQAQFRMQYENRGINLTSYTKRHAAEMFAQFFNITEEEAIAEIDHSNVQMVSKLWLEKFPKPPSIEVETAFYESEEVGRAYILELLNWNFTPTFTMLRQTLTNIRNQQVLEIGSGIGTMALQMIIQGNNMVALEINPMLRQFIAMRYEVIEKNVESALGGLDIVGEKWFDKVENESIDTTIAFDVLEHLSLEALRKLLKRINRVLKIDGRLLYHANWYQQDIYPMHHNHSKIWNKLLKDMGFAPISNMEAIKIRSLYKNEP